MVGVIFSLLVTLFFYMRKKQKRNKPLTKFDLFIEKAFELESNQHYDEAVKVLQDGLNLDKLTDLERGDMYMRIGGIFSKQGRYTIATEYFDKAFYITQQNRYPYHDSFQTVLDCYVQANRRQDAELLLNNLVSRQYYDRKFNKLESYIFQAEKTNG